MQARQIARTIVEAQKDKPLLTAGVVDDVDRSKPLPVQLVVNEVYIPLDRSDEFKTEAAILAEIYKGFKPTQEELKTGDTVDASDIKLDYVKIAKAHYKNADDFPQLPSWWTNVRLSCGHWTVQRITANVTAVGGQAVKVHNGDLEYTI